MDSRSYTSPLRRTERSEIVRRPSHGVHPMTAQANSEQERVTMTTNTGRKPAFHADDAISAGHGSEPDSGAAAVVLAGQRWSRRRGRSPGAGLVPCGGAAAVFAR